MCYKKWLFINSFHNLAALLGAKHDIFWDWNQFSQNNTIQLQKDVENNIAFLELKYGNIYGGFLNFFAIAEVSLLVFEHRSKKIFIETWVNKVDVDYVSVYSKTNELGHTVGRVKEVVNMRSGRVRPFMEEFKVDKRAAQGTIFGRNPKQTADYFLITV